MQYKFEIILDSLVIQNMDRSVSIFRNYFFVLYFCMKKWKEFYWIVVWCIEESNKYNHKIGHFLLSWRNKKLNVRKYREVSILSSYHQIYAKCPSSYQIFMCNSIICDSFTQHKATNILMCPTFVAPNENGPQ